MNKIILALDTTNLEEALDITKKIKNKIFTVKLGLEFFNAHGKAGVKKFNEIGVTNLLLDLKLKDLPETVYRSIKALDDIKFAFFLLPEQAQKYPEIVSRIVSECHILGSHFLKHRNHMLDTKTIFLKSLNDSIQEIESISKDTIQYCRVPYGHLFPWQDKWISQSGYEHIFWSLSSKDYLIEAREKVISRIQKNIQVNDIVLLVAIIVGSASDDGCQSVYGDLTDDGQNNVMDVIQLVNAILNPAARADASAPTSVELLHSANGLAYNANADGLVGFEITVYHDGTCDFNLTKEAFIADSYTTGNITKIVIF